MRLIRIGHLSSASVSSVSKSWKMLMARTCIDAEFVVPMLNFLNILSPWWCFLTSKWLVGRAVQHLCIFVGCTVADQTTELTWKPAGKGGWVYTESKLDPVISQDVARGFFFHCYLQFVWMQSTFPDLLPTQGDNSFWALLSPHKIYFLFLKTSQLCVCSKGEEILFILGK